MLRQGKQESKDSLSNIASSNQPGLHETQFANKQNKRKDKHVRKDRQKASRSHDQRKWNLQQRAGGQRNMTLKAKHRGKLELCSE